MWVMWSDVICSACSGPAGEARTWRPLSWRMAYVRRSSGSRRAASSRMASMMVCFGVEVEVGRDAAELQVEVDQDDLIRLPARRGDRDVRGDRGRPDAALGLYTATVRRGLASVSPSAEMTGASSLERWNRSSSASMRASTSRESKGRAMTSSAPASRNRMRSSTSSVAATHRIGTRPSPGSRGSRGTRRRRAASGAPVAPRSMTASWCSATAANARPCRRPGDGVADVGQDRAERVGGRGIGVEDQDGAGGHRASGSAGGRRVDGSG